MKEAFNGYIDVVRCIECRSYFPLEMAWVKEDKFKDKYIVCPVCVEIK